jgi:hypothetical protein
VCPRGLRACLRSERSWVRVPVFFFKLFLFSNCLSQINIGLNISVAISLISLSTAIKNAEKHWWHYTKTNCCIISQPSPFWHSETQTNSSPSVLWCFLYAFKPQWQWLLSDVKNNVCKVTDLFKKLPWPIDRLGKNSGVIIVFSVSC